MAESQKPASGFFPFGYHRLSNFEEQAIEPCGEGDGPFSPRGLGDESQKDLQDLRWPADSKLNILENPSQFFQEVLGEPFPIPWPP